MFRVLFSPERSTEARRLPKNRTSKRRPISRKSRSVRVVITSGRCCSSRTWLPRKETASVTGRSRQSVPSPQTNFTSGLSRVRGQRPRQGEKVVGLCARAWSVVHRLYPDVFNQDVPDPWRGVTKNRRTKAIKPAAHPRAGLHLCQVSDPGRIPRSGGGRGHLFRMAAASRERLG
jgi:hypothetical protein